MTLTLVNPCDSGWTRHKYLVSVGAYLDDHYLVFANSFEKAVNEIFYHLESHSPGVFCTDAVLEEYERLVAEGMDPCEAQEQACIDTVSDDDQTNYLPAWEIAIVEDPDRETILRLQGRL